MGSITALPSADPDRAIVSTISPVANPVMPENIAHMMAPPNTSGIRFDLSAYWAIGTCSANAAIDESATIDNAVEMLMSKESRISGSRTPNAVRSSSSTALRPNRMSSGNAASPPHRSVIHCLGWRTP